MPDGWAMRDARADVPAAIARGINEDVASDVRISADVLLVRTIPDGASEFLANSASCWHSRTAASRATISSARSWILMSRSDSPCASKGSESSALEKIVRVEYVDVEHDEVEDDDLGEHSAEFLAGEFT